MTESQFAGLLEEAETGALDTSVPIYPAGIYNAQIDKLNEPERISTKVGDRVVMKIRFKPLTPIQVSEAIDSEINYAPVNLTLWLDLTENGKLSYAKGANVGLGRLRAAVGQNDAKTSWSLRDLFGQTCKIEVVHNPMKDGTLIAEVKRVVE